MLPMCVRNRRQEENIDQVYCNIEGGGRSRVIKLLLLMGELPNSFYERKPEMTFCSISMLPLQLIQVQRSPETWLHVDDRWWSMDTGTLPEQLSTWPETGDYAVLQSLLVQCTRLVCSVQLPDTTPRQDPALKILQCYLIISSPMEARLKNMYIGSRTLSHTMPINTKKMPNLVMWKQNTSLMCDHICFQSKHVRGVLAQKQFWLEIQANSVLI